MEKLANVCVDISDAKNVSEDYLSVEDIQQLAESEDSSFMLDIESDNLPDIIDEVLLHLISNKRIPLTNITDEIRTILLTDEPSPKLRNTFRDIEDSNWLVAHGEFSKLRERVVVFVRLAHATNLGMDNGAEKFFFLVLAPTNLPFMVSAKETASSFASILLDIELRYVLENGSTEEIREALLLALQRQSQKHTENSTEPAPPTPEQAMVIDALRWRLPCAGIWKDLERRLPWYFHDYWAGMANFRSIVKSCAAILFIYCACILPAIAFGLVNHIQTEGNMGVDKMIYAQAIAGVVVALFGGQPLLVVLSTAPFTLYIKIIYGISVQAGLTFWPLYGWVGVWNSFFLVLYSVTGFTNILKYSTRFSQETFGMFITVAFMHDGLRPTLTFFVNNFYLCDDCEQAHALLYLILVYGTGVIGFKLYMYKRSALLNPRLREVLSDYSLPIAVAIMTFVGSVIFMPVDLEPFPVPESPPFRIIYILQIPVWGIFLACPLGFMLSLIFFMDQSLSSAATNHPDNQLRKGPAYHLDLYVMGTLMLLFSLVGLPWVNAAIPHSPFHARILADLEVIYHPNGLIEERIVRVRETRLTGLIASVLIGISVLMVPIPLQVIPVPVLYGVFVYLSLTGLPNFQFWERLKLIITQRNLYPPNSYLRKVPLKVIHRFTLFQLVVILWLVFWGLTPVDYIQLFLGAALISIIPIRAIFGRLFFKQKHLRHLDKPTIGV